MNWIVAWVLLFVALIGVCAILPLIFAGHVVAAGMVGVAAVACFAASILGSINDA